KAVKRHLLQAFAIMGVPTQIKTDNGPTYRSDTLATFLAQWKVQHLFRVPYSSTGQVIIEHTQHT
ncbi:POK6 protein, partial [Columbina picui]|nr:POK6 protein [Columbina picui]